MLQTSTFNFSTPEYEAWFEKYPHVYQSKLLAIKRKLNQLPENIKGIEVGLGTGKYALALGIMEGVEPVKSMRDIALRNGIDAMDGEPEHLPYKDLCYDFVLLVTTFHLDNAALAFKEAYRVLKNNGSLILAFIDRDSLLGKKYIEKSVKTTFYKNDMLFSVEMVKKLLKEARFKNPEFSQTVFNDPELNKKVEEPKEGSGEGSIIVVRATKG